MRLLSSPYAYSAKNALTADTAATATSAASAGTVKISQGPSTGANYLTFDGVSSTANLWGGTRFHQTFDTVSATPAWNPSPAGITWNNPVNFRGSSEWVGVVLTGDNAQKLGFGIANAVGTHVKQYIDLNAAGWQTPSDRRLKKNFQSQEGGWLEKLEAIKPVYYNMTADADGAPKQLGVIAQDVEQAFPSMVSKGGSDGMMGVSYSHLGVAAIGGIKELSHKTDKEISALKEENQQLKDTLDQLMKRLQALENQVQ